MYIRLWEPLVQHSDSKIITKPGKKKKKKKKNKKTKKKKKVPNPRTP